MAGGGELSGSIDGLGALIEALTEAVRDLTAAFRAAPQTGRGGPPGGPPGPGGKGGGGGGGGLGGLRAFIGAAGIGGISGPVSAFTGAISEASGSIAGMAGVAAAAPVALAALVTQLGAFVRVLDPATMELFDRALSSLQATIGQAFLPVIQVLTGVIEQAADIIAPVFEQLAGVLGALAGQMSGYLLTVVRLVADVLAGLVEAAEPLLSVVVELYGVLGVVIEIIRGILPLVAALLRAIIFALRPLLDVVVGVVKALAAFLQMVFAIVNVFAAVITAFLGQAAALGELGIKEFFDGFVKSIQFMTRAIIGFAARLLRLFGMESAFEALKKAYSPSRGGEGQRRLAAPSDFGFADLGSIIREGTLAAAKATGAGGPESTEDFLKVISKDLGEIAGESRAKLIEKIGKDIADVLIACKDILAYLTAGRKAVKAAAKRGGGFAGALIPGLGLASWLLGGGGEEE